MPSFLAVLFSRRAKVSVHPVPFTSGDILSGHMRFLLKVLLNIRFIQK